jgi:hypothetical protein
MQRGSHPPPSPQAKSLPLPCRLVHVLPTGPGLELPHPSQLKWTLLDTESHEEYPGDSLSDLFQAKTVGQMVGRTSHEPLSLGYEVT